MAEHRDDVVPMWAQLLVAGVILSVWTASMVKEILSSGDYTTAVALHGITGSLVPLIFGRAFGRALAERIRDGNGN